MPSRHSADQNDPVRVRRFAPLRKSELASRVGDLECGEELAAEQCAHDLPGEEVLAPRPDPAGAVERQPAAVTMACTSGCNCRSHAQVCSILVRPSSAPRCPGSRPSSSSVADAGAKSRSKIARRLCVLCEGLRSKLQCSLLREGLHDGGGQLHRPRDERPT
jgi:hypothetical protein